MVQVVAGFMLLGAGVAAGLMAAFAGCFTDMEGEGPMVTGIFAFVAAMAGCAILGLIH